MATPPPVIIQPDVNGLDLATGAFVYSRTHFTIGDPGGGGFAYGATFIDTGWRDNFVGTIDSTGSTYTVSIGAKSEVFTLASSVYTPTGIPGSTLTFSSGAQQYTYTDTDGVVYVFDKAWANGGLPWNANEGRLISANYLNGRVDTYNYNTITAGGVTAYRLQSVTNNLGYQVHFDYYANTAAGSGNLPDWRKMTVATGINNAYDYCGPTANTCSGLSVTYPSATFGVNGSGYNTVTDSLGNVFQFKLASGVIHVRNPGSSSDNLVVTPGASVVTDFGTWTYSYSYGPITSINTITDPNSNVRTIGVDTATGRITADFDVYPNTTSYAYDGYGRLTGVTRPEGDSTSLWYYDNLGNVGSVTSSPKTGSGLGTIVTGATFGSCIAPIGCHVPATTLDAMGKTTNYSWDNTNKILTVTAPAPTSGGTRPETRYKFTAKYAYYKNSGGSIVAAASPVYVLTETSTCATGSWSSGACSTGGANEVKTVITYGATSVANNLLPTSVTTGDTSGSPLTATVAYTYSEAGDTLTADGPLSGSTDTTRYRYDSARRFIGVIGPDPDSGGSLHNRAVKYTYNANSQVTAAESGTVNSQSDGDWAAFSSLQTQTAGYDAMGRKTSASLASGGTTYSLVQYAYDNANRPTCTAVRMNPTYFGSPPGSACTMGTTGSYGEDRITLLSYNAANEVTQVTSGYGSASSINEATSTYSSNGKLATVTDGAGNKTTFEYDD